MNLLLSPYNDLVYYLKEVQNFRMISFKACVIEVFVGNQPCEGGITVAAYQRSS
jgi:hypothetical protein